MLDTGRRGSTLAGSTKRLPPKRMAGVEGMTESEVACLVGDDEEDDGAVVQTPRRCAEEEELEDFGRRVFFLLPFCLV